MRTIIYILLVGYMSISGFFSLKSNDWEVRELPSFLNSGSSADRVLPQEEWKDILPGRWSYKVVVGNAQFKGIASFKEDGSFVKKLGFVFYEFDYKYDLKASGTVKGTWEILDDRRWKEVYETCNFSSEEPCGFFGESKVYGEIDDDTEDYRVIYFNYDRIEIRAEDFNGGDPTIWKYTRDD